MTHSRIAGMRRLRSELRARASAGGDDGNAVVEFLGVALLLLVPVVYLALTLGRLQAATFAVDGAAREAARIAQAATDSTTAATQVLAAVGIAFADQGVAADPAGATVVTCDGDCLAPGTTITVEVTADVPLPGTAWLQCAVPLEVPVTATATAVRDTYVEAPRSDR